MNTATNVQLICNRVFCLVDGFRVELERVCEDHQNEDLEHVDTNPVGVLG